MMQDILKLSPTERILMVEAIWDSIADKNDLFTVSNETKKMLDERLETYKKNPDQGMDWETVKRRIQDQL